MMLMLRESMMRPHEKVASSRGRGDSHGDQQQETSEDHATWQ